MRRNGCGSAYRVSAGSHCGLDEVGIFLERAILGITTRCSCTYECPAGSGTNVVSGLCNMFLGNVGKHSITSN